MIKRSSIATVPDRPGPASGGDVNLTSTFTCSAIRSQGVHCVVKPTPSKNLDVTQQTRPLWDYFLGKRSICITKDGDCRRRSWVKVVWDCAAAAQVRCGAACCYDDGDELCLLCTLGHTHEPPPSCRLETSKGSAADKALPRPIIPGGAMP